MNNLGDDDSAKNYQHIGLVIEDGQLLCRLKTCILINRAETIIPITRISLGKSEINNR